MFINFLREVWREVEPIFKHGFVAASIALIAAGLLKLFERVLPSDYADDLHHIDHILVVVLFWLFGGYTLGFLAIRLGHHLYKEFRGTIDNQKESKPSVVHLTPQPVTENIEPVILQDGIHLPNNQNEL
ncbi:MAG TPA: hypothetical protein VJ464_21505 [Blastocatellia bacterium]|nr:hypothetical protein [Blastocatellia bacterium]